MLPKVTSCLLGMERVGEGAEAAAVVCGRGRAFCYSVLTSGEGGREGTKGLSSLIQTAVSQWSSVITVMWHTEATCRGMEKIQSCI